MSRVKRAGPQPPDPPLHCCRLTGGSVPMPTTGVGTTKRYRGG